MLGNFTWRASKINYSFAEETDLEVSENVDVLEDIDKKEQRVNAHPASLLLYGN